MASTRVRNLEVGEGRPGKGGTGLSKLGRLRGRNNPPPTTLNVRLQEAEG